MKTLDHAKGQVPPTTTGINKERFAIWLLTVQTEELGEFHACSHLPIHSKCRRGTELRPVPHRDGWAVFWLGAVHVVIEADPCWVALVGQNGTLPDFMVEGSGTCNSAWIVRDK